MTNEVDILLVEDNYNDSELAMRALKRSNLAKNVIIVRDGEEALDYIFARGSYKTLRKLNLPKLILLDLKLPKIDGVGVLKVIKNNPLTQHIPVVVLTSSNEQCDLEETYRLGVNSYVVKPVDFEKFVSLIGYVGLYWLQLNKQPHINDRKND
jgi:two-component system, response regulator